MLEPEAHRGRSADVKGFRVDLGEIDHRASAALELDQPELTLEKLIAEG